MFSISCSVSSKISCSNIYSIIINSYHVAYHCSIYWYHYIVIYNDGRGIHLDETPLHHIMTTAVGLSHSHVGLPRCAVHAEPLLPGWFCRDVRTSNTCQNTLKDSERIKKNGFQMFPVILKDFLKDSERIKRVVCCSEKGQCKILKADPQQKCESLHQLWSERPASWQKTTARGRSRKLHWSCASRPNSSQLEDMMKSWRLPWNAKHSTNPTAQIIGCIKVFQGLTGINIYFLHILTKCAHQKFGRPHFDPSPSGRNSINGRIPQARWMVCLCLFHGKSLLRWMIRRYPLVIEHSHGIDGPFIDALPIKNGDFPWLC